MPAKPCVIASFRVARLESRAALSCHFASSFTCSHEDYIERRDHGFCYRNFAVRRSSAVTEKRCAISEELDTCLITHRGGVRTGVRRSWSGSAGSLQRCLEIVMMTFSSDCAQSEDRVITRCHRFRVFGCVSLVSMKITGPPIPTKVRAHSIDRVPSESRRATAPGDPARWKSSVVALPRADRRSGRRQMGDWKP